MMREKREVAPIVASFFFGGEGEGWKEREKEKKMRNKIMIKKKMRNKII